MVSRVDNEAGTSQVLLPVLLSAFAIPVSMLFWVVNVVYSILTLEAEHLSEGHPMISPWRWLATVFIPVLVILWGLRRHISDLSGAILGYKEGGQRNWIQVLCNGGMASQLTLYLLGCDDRPIDFDKDYKSSRLSVGILGAFACCNGDTWAAEFGSVIGNCDAFLITTRKRVPRGTNDGVSWIGLFVSLLEGLVVGVFHYLAVLYFGYFTISRSSMADNFDQRCHWISRKHYL